jgi:hypothetical protein
MTLLDWLCRALSIVSSKKSGIIGTKREWPKEGGNELNNHKVAPTIPFILQWHDDQPPPFKFSRSRSIGQSRQPKRQSGCKPHDAIIERAGGMRTDDIAGRPQASVCMLTAAISNGAREPAPLVGESISPMTRPKSPQSKRSMRRGGRDLVSDPAPQRVATWDRAHRCRVVTRLLPELQCPLVTCSKRAA